jgi:hypothetical protein
VGVLGWKNKLKNSANQSRIPFLLSNANTHI